MSIEDISPYLSLINPQEEQNLVEGKKKQTGSLRSKQGAKGLHMRSKKANSISATDLSNEQPTVRGTVNMIGRMDDPTNLLLQALPENVVLNTKRPVQMNVCVVVINFFFFFLLPM